MKQTSEASTTHAGKKPRQDTIDQAAVRLVGQDWLSECDPKVWLLEEYKLLTSHYFHEDNQFFTTTTVFGTFNAALLAFMTSTLFRLESPVRVLGPLLGIALCLSWVACMIRIRECRLYVEGRIARIEAFLHAQWKANTSSLTPLDLRTMAEWRTTRRVRWFNRPYFAFRDAPVSLTMLLVPTVFMGIWLILLILSLNGNWHPIGWSKP